MPETENGGFSLIWRGVAAESLGVRAARLPPVTTAAPRRRRIALPGRSGDLPLAAEEGYACCRRRIPLLLSPGSDLRRVRDWLRGEGTLVLGNEPDRALAAAVSGETRFEPIPGRRFFAEAVFDCQPLKAAWPAPEPVTADVEAGALTLYNPGDVAARPVCTVEGSGTVTLSVGEASVEMDLEAAGAAACVIDTGEGTFTDPADGRSLTEFGRVSDHGLRGLWLPARAETAVTWRGEGLTALTVRPEWRWL